MIRPDDRTVWITIVTETPFTRACNRFARIHIDLLWIVLVVLGHCEMKLTTVAGLGFRPDATAVSLDDPFTDC